MREFAIRVRGTRVITVSLILATLAAACGVQTAAPPPRMSVSYGLPAQRESGRAFYVSPIGRPWNSGQRTSPLDLETVLSRLSPVKPGDWVWLRGGTYYGTFKSFLVGTEDQPIVVRQYPGERAILDSAASGEDKVLQVNGSHTWYWGFEVMSSGVKRRTRVAGCEETDRGFGLWIWGSNNKFINLIVHDLCDGYGLWGRDLDGEIVGQNIEVYGNLIYYNGVEQTPIGRGQGHGLYVTNPQHSARVLRDNIVFANFSQGIRVGDEPVNSPIVEGNIVFQNGRHLPGLKGRNIYIGGQDTSEAPMTGAVIRDNYTYFDAGAFNGQFEEGMNLGLWWPGGSGEVIGNVIAGGNHALKLGYEDNFTPTACRGNEIYGQVGNYVRRVCPSDANIYHDMERPKTNRIIVRPNAFEPGRANIAVYNWEMRPSVSLSLEGTGLAVGDPFEVRDVWDFFGRPVATGTYTRAPVSIPMTGLRAVPMNGAADIPIQPSHTAPEFGAFIVLRRN